MIRCRERIGLLRYLLFYCLAGTGFFLFLMLFAWIVRPDMGGDFPAPGPGDLAVLEEARKMALHVDSPPVLQQDVDYSGAEKASWLPRGESPVLAGLVVEGKLPPVLERVGSEPCVIRGVDGSGFSMRRGKVMALVGESENEPTATLPLKRERPELLTASGRSWQFCNWIKLSINSSSSAFNARRSATEFRGKSRVLRRAALTSRI